ncbi:MULTISPECIES: hypothetical protein [Clostridia]|jgi:hypothetical protein|nr:MULTISPECIES: hypothetical protein [Clostridia]
MIKNAPVPECTPSLLEFESKVSIFREGLLIVPGGTLLAGLEYGGY